MTPSERIKAMLAYLGINAKKFSAHLGYERPQLLYDIINDRTKRITELLATRIVSAYPQFNRVWLITGEGEMLKDEAASESISQVQSGSNNTQINGDNSGNWSNSYRSSSNHSQAMPLRYGMRLIPSWAAFPTPKRNCSPTMMSSTKATAQCLPCCNESTFA